MKYICLVTIGILSIVYAYSVNLFLTTESFRDVDFVTNKGYPTNKLCAPPLTTEPEVSGPADTTLENPRDPYHLLGDYLKPASKDTPVNVTSEYTYKVDGQRKIELTGTYGQVTNNYKRSKPDNGSTLLHDLSLSFYK
jgi:hypothetical protein